MTRHLHRCGQVHDCAAPDPAYQPGGQYPRARLTLPENTEDETAWWLGQARDNLDRLTGLVSRVRIAVGPRPAEDVFHPLHSMFGAVASLGGALGEVVERLASTEPDQRGRRAWRPEDGDTRCQRCGLPNPVWWADDQQWNDTVRSPRDEGEGDPGGVLCPSCYHSRWLLRGGWRQR